MLTTAYICSVKINRAMKIRGILLFIALSLGLGAQTVTVTNTSDAGVGSLRQAILDANSNWGINNLVFNIPTSDPNYNSSTGVFTIGVTTSVLPEVQNRVLLIDGFTQTAFTGNTNTTTFGAGGVVGVDNVSLPTVDGPEIEIVDASPNKDFQSGLWIGAEDVTIRGLCIHSFGNTWFLYSDANIRAAGGARRLKVYDCVLGSEAHADMAPVGDVNGGPNFQALGIQDGKLYRNYIAYSETMGGFLRSGCTGWKIYHNDFNNNGISNPICDGLDVADFCETDTIRENLFRNNRGNGFDSFLSAGDHLVENNTAYNNGLSNTETSGMRIYGSKGNVISKNIIRDNVGAGVLITSDAQKHKITRNSIYNNGNILANGASAKSKQIGIDLLYSTDSHKTGGNPFITINDDSDNDNGGNYLINFPVIDLVSVSGGTLTVKGFAPAGATVEFFKGDFYSGALMVQGKAFLFSAVEGSGGDNDATFGSYGPGNINGFNQGQESAINRFEFSAPVPAGFSVGDLLTATSFVSGVGTSEFCAAYTAIAGSGGAPIAVVPELNCIYIDVNGDIVGRFGYTNSNATIINEAFGAANEFVPSPADRGQGTSFNIGTHSGVFEETFPIANSLTWNLQGGSVTADINTIRCPADLRVQQSVSNNTPNIGDNVTFTITIDNLTSNTPATAVEIAYFIDPNFTYLSHNTPPGTTYNNVTGVWSIPEVVFGTSVTFTVTVKVNGNGTNVAAVQSQNQIDPVSSNNSAAETIATGSSGPNNGGIESDGSMASLIASRNFNRIKSGEHTFYQRINEAPLLSDYRANTLAKVAKLSDFIPATGPQNAPAVVTSPTDLIGITNALDVFSADYFNNNQNRLGGILAIETKDEVYNHTKVICDRLNGASLNDIKTIQVKGHNFILARLDQEDGSVDMAVTFVAYEKANGDIVIDARWNQNDYTIEPSDKVYNFQVWTVSESLTISLVQDVITLMEANNSVSSITASNVITPTVYVKSGHYENGKMYLNVINTIGAGEVNIQANRTRYEGGARVNIGELVALDANKFQETIVWNSGYLFDSGFEMTNDIGGGRDILYLADGPWGTDFERDLGVTNAAFDVTTETGYVTATAPAEKHLERDISFSGNLKNYFSAFRMLRAGHLPMDMSAFNQIEFEASLSGFSEITVTLVTNDITNWSEQYRKTITINNGAMGVYSVDVEDLLSSANAPLDLSQVLNVTFSVIGDYQTFQPITLDISNVTFNTEGRVVGQKEFNYGANQGLNVYPNPFSGAAHIDVALASRSDVRVELYDLSGKMVDAVELGNFSSGANTAVYTPSVDLLDGVYLMKVVDSNSTRTQKVIYRK
jgi:uncharacterized repeat protein (TIGR01451 family)